MSLKPGASSLFATNRPDMLDPAMCWPGWFDKLLYINLPVLDERGELVHMLLTRHCVLLTPDNSAAGTSTSAMGHVMEMIIGPRDGYSRADLAVVVREGVRALGTLDEMHAKGLRVEKDETVGGVVVPVEDFEFALKFALKKVAPSVSKVQRRRYEALRKTFRSVFGGNGKERKVCVA